MPTTATLTRYTHECVNLSHLWDALTLTDEQREDAEVALGNWYTWGEAAATLASVEGVLYWISHTLPDALPAATALLDGVHFVNLEG